ncbi:MAG: DUF4832 domain-containing protein [Planctomycetes bacterium]|nr:DUF4832 domain-containing protein [Planctomycetota bacterium]
MTQTLKIFCPQCTKRYIVKSELIGRSVSCKACQLKFLVQIPQQTNRKTAQHQQNAATKKLQPSTKKSRKKRAAPVSRSSGMLSSFLFLLLLVGGFCIYQFIYKTEVAASYQDSSTSESIGLAAEASQQKSPKKQEDFITLQPKEFKGAINNPLKGFRTHKKGGYGLLVRKYVGWHEIERHAGDSVDRIIYKTNEWMKKYRNTNVKMVPRVFLDWNDDLTHKGNPNQHWPKDMHRFDYDSEQFQERLLALIEKMGKAWDNDPRIYAIQMGLIGKWGEHHTPSPTLDQRQKLTTAFKKAFKNKPILVRHTDPEFMDAGFGIYYDTFAYIGREPKDKSNGQFPWMAMNQYPDIWKSAPIEGEVEYNWQKSRDSAKPKETFGESPNETMTNKAYRRYMIDKIRKYHTSYLGWIDGYDQNQSDVLKGAGEVQKAFGYRFLLESFSYPKKIIPGDDFEVELQVRNTGSAPFYLNWPVAVSLLKSETLEPIWTAQLKGVDIRSWLPGEKWNSKSFSYEKAAKLWTSKGHAVLPKDIPKGNYIIALSILDREGGMTPSVRFAIENYIRGGYQPMGGIGVNQISNQKHSMKFDSPAFDPSLAYKVSEDRLAIQDSSMPDNTPVQAWQGNEGDELINPWRYWGANTRGDCMKLLSYDGPVDGIAGRKVMTLKGDFGWGSSIFHTFFNQGKLEPGHYRFTFQTRGSNGLEVAVKVFDNWTPIVKVAKIQLSSHWQKHQLDFQIEKAFKSDTKILFDMPHTQKGSFSLTDYHLIKIKEEDSRKLSSR